MPRRQPLPTLWLMTDERSDAGLEATLFRLPRGSGVIFRHHATPPRERRRRYDQVRRITRARRLVLVLAGGLSQAVAWKADGAHGRSPHRRAARALLRTAPAHGRRQLVAARHADIVLLSPVFPTRSHPGAPPLGPIRFGLVAGAEHVIALGGMDAHRFRRLRPLGACGWAGIDAFDRPENYERR